MDIGTALAVLGPCAIITAAIIRFAPSKGCNDNGKYVSRAVCQERFNRIMAELDEMKQMLRALQGLD